MRLSSFHFYHSLQWSPLLHLNPNTSNKQASMLLLRHILFISILAFSSLLFISGICLCGILTKDYKNKPKYDCNVFIFFFLSTLTFLPLSSPPPFGSIICLHLLPLMFVSILFVFVIVFCCPPFLPFLQYNLVFDLHFKGNVDFLIFYSFKWKHYLPSLSPSISLSLPRF